MRTSSRVMRRSRSRVAGQAYSLRPATEAPLGPTRLGLLPVADETYPRTANVILPPDHPVWALESADAVKSWLRETFPTIPLEDAVSADEAAAFASARAGAFPAPCYVPKQTLTLPSGQGVALVGDAIHAFPPVCAEREPPLPPAAHCPLPAARHPQPAAPVHDGPWASQSPAQRCTHAPTTRTRTRIRVGIRTRAH
jgi:hypothetical protein